MLAKYRDIRKYRYLMSKYASIGLTRLNNQRRRSLENCGEAGNWILNFNIVCLEK